MITSEEQGIVTLTLGDLMDQVSMFFDTLTVAVSLVLLFLSLWIWRFFKGGIMDNMSKLLIATSNFLLVSSILCFSTMLMEMGEWLTTMHEIIDFAGIVLLTCSVYMFYLGWNKLKKGIKNDNRKDE